MYLDLILYIIHNESVLLLLYLCIYVNTIPTVLIAFYSFYKYTYQWACCNCLVSFNKQSQSCQCTSAMILILLILFFVNFSKRRITFRRKLNNKFCYFVWCIAWFWNNDWDSIPIATCEVKGMCIAMCGASKGLTTFLIWVASPFFFSIMVLQLL